MFDQNSQQPQEIDPVAAFDGLVGEGKKYATPQELAKAYAHADTHLAVLEAENAKLREQASKGQTVAEILAELQKQQGQPTQKPNTQDQGAGGATQPDVQKLVEEALKRELSARQSQDNQRVVESYFKEKFGTKAGDMFTALGKELGMDLESLSATNPAAVKALVEKMTGNTQQPGQSFSLQSGVRQPGSSGAEANATTRSGILALAEKEGWSTSKKYATLHAAYNKALTTNTVNEFNR
jgi:hypothetical protein